MMFLKSGNKNTHSFDLVDTLHIHNVGVAAHTILLAMSFMKVL